MEKVKEIYHKYKEMITYVIFGGLTTVVNIITYLLLTKIGKLDMLISNILAWCISVLFAYVTNPIFVFESKKKGFKPIALEMISFYIARIVSLICCDIVLFYLMVEICHINDVITKLILQVVVIVMNYVLSKFMIFKK